MRRPANQDGAVTRSVPRGTPLTDPTASSASSSSWRMTLHLSKYSFPDSVRLRRRLLRLSRRDPKCFSRNIRCLLVIAVDRLNRSAAPTKLPDSTTCRNTFMLRSVSIPDMVYLAAENQPEGITPLRLEKEQSRSGWEICDRSGRTTLRQTTLSSMCRLYSAATRPTIHVSFMQRFTLVNVGS